ncbi:MFS transporter [Bradyrhizobium sp. AZCC 2230]|uniref:MFS transporter n=1 Tax=Bradyrhizobium sp. AZCC 2230 TaxID=3117021 RepID=UPI003FA5F201
MPLGAYRPRIVVLCLLIVLMDGFDRQAIGFVATDVASSLDIPIQSFGPVFSAGLLGAMPGAFVLGPLGDHFGRRWMLTGSAITSAWFLTTSEGYDAAEEARGVRCWICSGRCSTRSSI